MSQMLLMFVRALGRCGRRILCALFLCLGLVGMASAMIGDFEANVTASSAQVSQTDASNTYTLRVDSTSSTLNAGSVMTLLYGTFGTIGAFNASSNNIIATGHPDGSSTGCETKLTLSEASGKLFNLDSLDIGEIAGGSPSLRLESFRGATSAGTINNSLSWNQTLTWSLSANTAFQNISKVEITGWGGYGDCTQTNNFKVALDNISFSNVHALVVSYNGNGNDGGSVPIDGNGYGVGGSATVLGNSNGLTRSGYAFNGWNTAADGSGTAYAAGATISNLSSAVTLYAKWVAKPVITAVSPNYGLPAGGTSVTITGTTLTGASTVQFGGVNAASYSVDSATQITAVSPAGTAGNTVDITVTTPGGTSATGSADRFTYANATSSLSALSASTGTFIPTFSSGTTSYSFSVANSVTSLTITPTVSDSTSTVKVNGVSVTSGNASGSISLAVGNNTITVLVTAQDGAHTTAYTVSVFRAATSSIATLSALSLSSGSLSPSFASGTTSYTASVPNTTTSLTVTPTVSDSTATVKVNGTSVTSGSASGSIALNVGSNTITVLGTAQDGSTTASYTITVTRASSSVATLSNLGLSTGSLSPSFASGTTGYTASVPYTTTSLTVTPTVSDSTATVKVNGTSVASGSASGSIALNVGSNTITVIGTAQDGSSTATYTITVTRSAAATNANLANLALSTGSLSPSFASGTTGYTASVPNTTTSLTVTPTLSDGTATVKVNGTSVASGSASGSIALAVGSNTITVIGTAQDGSSTATYTITVSRAAASSVATLSSLSLSAGSLSPGFASITTGYAASVPFTTTSLTVTPTLSDSTATVKVNGISVTSGSTSGSIALNVGSNTITVIGTAQDGSSTATYTVTVTRVAAASVATLANLGLSAGSLSPTFASGTTSYTTSVPFTTTSLTVTPTLLDSAASVKVNGNAVASGSASAGIALAVGSNTISVVGTAQDGSTTATYTLTITRAAAANVATLSALSLSSASLTPGFSSSTPSYTVNVAYAVSALTVTPTLSDTNASVKVNGNAVISGNASGSIALGVGSNSINVLVTAQDGTSTGTYAITVVRAAASTVATLSGLTLSAGSLSPSFAVATTGYTASVGNSIAALTVTPSASDSTASIKVNGNTVASGAASSGIALNVGSNTLTVLVTAQDGSTTATYTVTVNRAATLSNVATLSALTLSAGSLSPTFASATTSYTASATGITSTTVTPTASHAFASIKVNGNSVASGAASGSLTVSTGSNTLTVLVTAEDGVSTATYTITLNVAAAPSNNSGGNSGNSGSSTPYNPYNQVGTQVVGAVNGMTYNAASSSLVSNLANFSDKVGVADNGVLVVSNAPKEAIKLSAATPDKMLLALPSAQAVSLQLGNNALTLTTDSEPVKNSQGQTVATVLATRTYTNSAGTTAQTLQVLSGQALGSAADGQLVGGLSLAGGSRSVMATASGSGASAGFYKNADGLSGSVSAESGAITLEIPATTGSGIRTLTLRAGEVARFDSNGALLGVYAGSLSGSVGKTGDPLTLTSPNGVASYPNQAARLNGVTLSRLAGSIGSVFAAGADSNVSLSHPAMSQDEHSGVVRWQIGANTYYALPLLPVSIDATVADGVVAQSDGTLVWTRQGVSLHLAPSLADPAQFAASAKAAGYSTDIGSDGTLMLTSGSAMLVARATYGLSSSVGSGQGRGFGVNAQGQATYTFADGTTQTLQAAPVNSTELAASIAALGSGWKMTLASDGSIQTNGPNGQQLTIVPDYNATAIKQSSLWNGAPGKVYFVYVRGGVQVMQGFTLR
jgi:uncharacterized repeat protein (TIGR02543 family)